MILWSPPLRALQQRVLAEPTIEDLSRLLLFAEPARFEFPSKNVTIRRGESVVLDCTVVGDNPINVQWTHNNNRLDTNVHRLTMSQVKTDSGLKSQLSIGLSDRQDSGVYRCTADNDYGRSEHFIYLAVQGSYVCESTRADACVNTGLAVAR